jgi:hypothetical protein
MTVPAPTFRVLLLALVALVVLDRVLIGGLDLTYDESGNGCRTLDEDSRQQFTLAAAPVAAAFVAWVVAGAARSKRRLREARPGGVPDSALLGWVLCTAAAVLVATVAPFVGVWWRILLVIALTPTALLGAAASFVYAYRSTGGATLGSVPVAALGGTVLVFAAALLMAGDGEILIC